MSLIILFVGGSPNKIVSHPFLALFVFAVGSFFLFYRKDSKNK